MSDRAPYTDPPLACPHCGEDQLPRDLGEPDEGGTTTDCPSCCETLVWATGCSICERPIEPRPLPLCDRCEATCRAHAGVLRAEREEREWRGDFDFDRRRANA